MLLLTISTCLLLLPKYGWCIFTNSNILPPTPIIQVLIASIIPAVLDTPGFPFWEEIWPTLATKACCCCFCCCSKTLPPPLRPQKPTCSYRFRAGHVRRTGQWGGGNFLSPTNGGPPFFVAAAVGRDGTANQGAKVFVCSWVLRCRAGSSALSSTPHPPPPSSPLPPFTTNVRWAAA